MKRLLSYVTILFVGLAGGNLLAEEAVEEKNQSKEEVEVVDESTVEDVGQAGVEVAEEDSEEEDEIEQRVYGWKEWILFEGKKKKMRAKFDSGAKTSSIHGENIKGFEKDGEKWVKFVLFDPNRKPEKAEPVKYECRVTRVARIRNADGQVSERRVVELDFWIGGEKRRAEFSLNDRGDMINPVLLGRTVVQTLGLIDTGRTYLMGENPMKKPVQKKVVDTPSAETSEDKAESGEEVLKKDEAGEKEADVDLKK